MNILHLQFHLKVSNIQKTPYCMSKKSWPISYSELLHKVDQDFLDIQYIYVWHNKNIWKLKKFYLHVIGPCHDPILPGHKHGGPDRQIAHLKRFHQLLRFIVPNVDVAVVQRHQHPLLGRVQVAWLDPVWPCGQFTFYIQLQRHSFWNDVIW